ncbi:MAG TPA: metal-dependent transcriptional regulator [Fimbriimonadales bacterium]|nr:metal-dependent transcriptional regulator [Fimbriimonadales bacterium]
MTSAIQDYVKAIYTLSRTGERANTKHLAEVLGNTQAAVSKMLRFLKAKGWVEHTPYYGARLTPAGEELALEMIRHHRLLERYLTEHLGFTPDEVHAQAEILEHHITEEFEDRIAELLGHPTTCPHGKPIPPKPTKEVRNASDT